MSKKHKRSRKAKGARSTAKSGSEQSRRKAKQARFTAESKKKQSRSPVMAVVVVVAVAIIGVGTIYALTRPESQPPSAVSEAPVAGDIVPSSDLPIGSSTEEQTVSVTAATSGHAPYPGLVLTDGQARLPLSTFDDGKAHYYTYMNGDQPIEFFILWSNDGVVRAAFNACDSCFSSRRGYLQDGDEMVCQNCGLRFASDQINVVRGGCNPSPLQRVVDGDTLVIQEEDLIDGATYF